MVAGGMPTANSTHPEDILEFVIAMFQVLEHFNTKAQKNLQIRVG